MLAYHFGWNIEYILSLSFVQLKEVSEGLGEILRQKYDPKAAEESEFEKNVKITEAKMKALREERKRKGLLGKPFKVNLQHLGA